MKTKPCTVILTIDGETRPAVAWARIGGISYNTLFRRIQRGIDPKAAIVLKDAEFLDRAAKSRANRHGAPDSHGKTPIRGSLNPRWVAQLQGFQMDWLDSPPPIAAKPSKRLGTPSRRRARTTSGGQS